MSCCEFDSNGDGGGGGESSSADIVEGSLEVTGDATQTIVIANLPVVGAGVFYGGTISARQSNGQRGFRFTFWTDAARNAVGSGILTQGTIGPSGYTDVAAVPYTTPGVPVGYAVVEANLVGNQVQVLFGGPAGQTVRWGWLFERILMGGATP